MTAALAEVAAAGVPFVVMLEVDRALAAGARLAFVNRTPLRRVAIVGVRRRAAQDALAASGWRTWFHRRLRCWVWEWEEGHRESLRCGAGKCCAPGIVDVPRGVLCLPCWRKRRRLGVRYG
jgi:hypothetical protein